MQSKTTTSFSITPSQLTGTVGREVCCLIEVREPAEQSAEHIHGGTILPFRLMLGESPIMKRRIN